MRLCQTCGGEIKGRGKMFCSIRCRNSANGKKIGGWNRSGMTRTCEECGSEFPVTASRLRVQGARTCSRSCLAMIQSRERRGVFGVGEANPMWKDGRSPLHYRRYLKDACEWCGTSQQLLIHHADENRGNNEPSNLVTVCKACHQRHHGEQRRDETTGRYS